MRAQTYTPAMAMAIALAFAGTLSASGGLTDHAPRRVQEVTGAVVPHLSGTQTTLVYGAFDFNDGTVQDWTVSGPYDEDGDGPFPSNFSASWSDAVNYPTPGTSDPIGDGRGSYKICNVSGHGIDNPGAIYWNMYWQSPDLSTSSVWQNATGYEIKLLNAMVLIGALPGDRLPLWVRLFVTIYDHDLGRNRLFAMGPYESIENSTESPEWHEESFDFSSILADVPNHTIVQLTVVVCGRMADYFEGGLYLDDVVPITGGPESPRVSIDVSGLDFGMFRDELSFEIANLGGGTLTWSISEDPDVPWLTEISPSSGSGDATVHVAVDRSLLTSNRDQTTLLIDSNGGSESIPVTVVRDTVSHWLQGQSKLLAEDGLDGDLFARDVAIYGDYAAIGAPYDDNENGTDAGAVYTFRREGERWVQQAKIVPEDGEAEELFGYSVDLQGEYLAVGCCWDDTAGEKSGSAYIFHYNGDTWEQMDKVIAGEARADQRFGIDVALDNGVLLVGAFFDDHFGERAGAADIFYQNGTEWQHQTRLYASDAAAGDWFGVSVDVEGDYAVVGARYDDNENGEDAGAVYVFRRDGDAWNEMAKVIPADGAAGDLFHVVAISGDRLAVGAYQDDENAGSVYIFRREGTSGVLEQKIQASDGDAGDMFGVSVSIDGDLLCVGAYRDEDSGENAGSVYLYRYDGGEWVEMLKLTAPDADPGDYYGLATALHGNEFLVAARNDDDNGENAGAAYYYELAMPSGTVRVPSDYSTIAEALAVVRSGDTVVVAAGTYTESIVLREGVVLMSEAGPQETAITGRGVPQLVLGAPDAVIEGFTIAGNDNGAYAPGHGILSRGDNVTVRHCIIRDNHTGIYLDGGSSAVIENNTIYGNDTGIYMQVEPRPRIVNNIICENTLSGIYRNTHHSLGNPFIQYNCYHNNGTDYDYYGSAWTPEPGVGELVADPLFVGGDPFDFHLQAGSPCIDAGDPASRLDPDGTRADMGALYHAHSTDVAGESTEGAPRTYALYPAYPNPFNPTTTIAFDVPRATHVELTVYDMLGRKVATLVNERYQPGRYQATFDAGDLATGLYLYRIRMGHFEQTRKVMLIR